MKVDLLNLLLFHVLPELLVAAEVQEFLLVLVPYFVLIQGFDVVIHVVLRSGLDHLFALGADEHGHPDEGEGAIVHLAIHALVILLFL